MKPLVFVGGGGHCLSVIEAARSIGRQIRGIIDSGIPVGTEVLGVPVLGGDDDIPRFVEEDCEFLITVGSLRNPGVRRRLAALVSEAGGTFGKIIASTAFVAPSASIGEGAVVLHGAIVNAEAEVGQMAIINSRALVEHRAAVGSFSHISTGAIVNGDAKIGDDCLVGSGAVVIQGITVCGGVTIGAGAVVVRSVGQPGIYAGVPAILIHSN